MGRDLFLELVVGLDQLLRLLLVFLDFVPIFLFGFFGEYAQVGKDLERVGTLPLYVDGVAAFDGDVDEAVFYHRIRWPE